jgi:outer membrane protein TolC
VNRANRRRVLCGMVLLFTCVVAEGSSLAQPPPPDQAPPPEPPPPKRDPLAEALAPRPGGLTPARVAAAATRNSPTLRVKQAELRAAEARVDQALVAYFPRLTATARYARVSDASRNLSQGALLGARTPGIPTVGSCPPALGLGTRPGDAGTCLLDSSGLPVAAVDLSLSPPLNNYSVGVGLTVPVSDYFRLSQAHAGAKHAANAKRHELEAESRLRAGLAEEVYFDWVRSKGQVIVAQQAVEQARAHLDDVKVVLDLGLGSRADNLRLEAQLARAEQLEIEAKVYATLAEERLRVFIQARPDKKLEIGIDVLKAPEGTRLETLEVTRRRALRNRSEMRALDESVQSLRKAEAVAESGYAPRVDAFGNVTLANPNPRVFPLEDAWNTTWEAGASLTWTINDTVAARSASAEASANLAAAVAQREALRESLRLEVAAAHADVAKASASIAACQRELEAAEETLRVRREEFLAGRVGSADLVDAETELTRARLSKLDAHVGLLAAKARLSRIVGAHGRTRR